MNDLAFWRSLRPRRIDDADLAVHLQALAGWPLQERLPFLGFLFPFFRHHDPAVRAAALGCLGGCAGVSALEPLVEALQDENEEVRRAAVEALRTCASGNDTARWAHVMFHPAADVRLAGMRFDRTFPPPEWWAIYLLPDPLCADVARQKIRDHPMPVEGLTVLLEYAHRGVVTREEARLHFCRHAWPVVVEFFSRWGQRESPQSSQIIETLVHPNGAEELGRFAGFDPVNAVFELFADAAEDEAVGWLGQMLRTIVYHDELTRQRLLASLVLGAGRWATKEGGHPLAKIAAVLDLRFLLCTWLPLSLRRDALHACYELGDHCPFRDQDLACRLLDSDVCRGPDGRLDLWAIGAALHFFLADPYERLLACVPMFQLMAAFDADPENGVWLLSVSRRSPRRKYLVRELCLQQRAQRSRILAILAELTPGDQLDFLEGVEAAIAAEIALELIARGRKLNDAKIGRLANLFGTKIAAGQIGPFLHGWLDRAAPQGDPLGQAILTVLSRQSEPHRLDQAVRALSVPLLSKFLTAAGYCAGFPYDREIALARSLALHGDEAIRSWATARLQQFTPSRSPKSESEKVLLLRAGLCHRLRAEAGPVEPNVDRCTCLLACHDLLDEVDAQLARFGSPDPGFVSLLDQEMVLHWRGEMRLPLVGHIWLYRWDAHADAAARLLKAEWPDLGEALTRAGGFHSPLLRHRFWEAVARLFEIWRWREKTTFGTLWTESLATTLCNCLAGDVADAAARILMFWRRVLPDHPLHKAIESRLAGALVDATEEIRQILSPWIDSRGLDPAPASDGLAPAVSEDSDVRRATELEVLFAEVFGWEEPSCRLAASKIAARDDGVAAIAELLCSPLPIRNVRYLADTVPDWPAGPDRDRALAAVHDENVPAETRFRIGMAFARRGFTHLLPALLSALAAPGRVGWVTLADWQGLLVLGAKEECSPFDLHKLLAVSPHPHIYEPLIAELTGTEDYSAVDIQRALLDFLECGVERMRELRVKAAEWLHKSGAWQPALPILLQADAAEQPPYPDLLVGQVYDVVVAVARAFLMIQRNDTDEEMLLALLLRDGVDEFAREEGLALLLQHGRCASVRQQARQRLRPSYTRDLKLRRVADTFAWGIRIGRELTGKLFSIQMISSEKLGYTRFNENKIFITPLPILRGELNGRQVVRALILHEYGHHMYHRGDEAQAVWKQSETEGLQKLLNLVADEHLERNLRALDRRFGDQLKLLASYAFQHTSREIAVAHLLTSLQGRSFEILSSAPLKVARRFGCVSVMNGRILMLMEKFGLSFARFVRALRMGLGNRHDDPKVGLALELFRGKFRKSTMPRLYEISKKLREIFGWETDILNSFDQDALSGDEAGDWDEVSEGITDDEVQSEVQQSLQGKSRKEGEGSKGGRGLNLGPDENFDLIAKVQPLPHDPAQHASYAHQVKRPAELLRRFLCKLGIGAQPQRFRLSGKSFDRTRARSVVLRGDPRMLIARELKIKTDLFIGVVVDCSGSMSHNANIEKAKLFGTLIAEAARSDPGIDVRLFGFTDQVIYDAGNANRCAVHALNAGGGNNDAAGLWHAALVAKASRRRAKLLVMISDGSPTECTVNALQSLVTRLSKRMKICCAQVGVCPLEHQCFPNYILLDQENVEASVRQFGTVMAKLVQQALRGG